MTNKIGRMTPCWGRVCSVTWLIQNHVGDASTNNAPKIGCFLMKNEKVWDHWRLPTFVIICGYPHAQIPGTTNDTNVSQGDPRSISATVDSNNHPWVNFSLAFSKMLPDPRLVRSRFWVEIVHRGLFASWGGSQGSTNLEQPVTANEMTILLVRVF